MSRLRIGVLISGRGSNLQALIKACSAETFPAEIALVISSRTEAPGLGLATAAGIPTAVFLHENRRDFAAAAGPLLAESKSSSSASPVSCGCWTRILSRPGATG